ncbi:MAG: hypothetical protein WC623_24380 [Pedobacter sp.]|uniref:hypothetical protein n=1 Tax=Pedobacter sp. TaxID=1411316 RepID=UPI0035696EDB
MAKILIIDIDSTIPNLALRKIEKYHLDLGDTVIWNLYLARFSVDKIYVSCVFDWNKEKCKTWEGYADIGGSGYDLSKKLPPEIEAVNPHINLGFTTRGCIRNCSFCIVPEKEGNIRIVGDLLDLWDGKNKDVVLMDNNILALPDHFELICKQARDNKIRIDFNQGLDCRLLTPDIAYLLKITPLRIYRFAFDHPSLLPVVDNTITILKNAGINQALWYVLAGFNTTFQEVLDRCNFLKSRKHNIFIQRYLSVKTDRRYVALARWANQHHIFHSMSWEEFCGLPVNKQYKQLI